jgi:hypothetical protein
MDLVELGAPALVMTLHESWKRYHPAIPASFGQTVVYGVNPMPSIIQLVVDRLNETRQSPYELWAPHYYPVATSSTEVIVDRVGCVVCVWRRGWASKKRVASRCSGRPYGSFWKSWGCSPGSERLNVRTRIQLSL